MSDNRRLFLVLALLNVLWSPVNYAIHVATDGGISPAAIGLLRWGSLAILLFGCLATPWFRRLTRAHWPSRRDAILAVLIGIGLFGPAHLIYYNALKLTSTVEAAVLGTTAPVWTAMLAFLMLRERVSRYRVAAITIGFIGAYIISVGLQVPELNHGNTGGNLLYLGGVIAESAVGVLAASIVRRSSGITILAFQVLGAAIAIGFGTVLAPQVVPLAVVHPTPAAWVSLAYLTLVPGLVCFSVWYIIVERTPLSLMVLSILLQPPLSALIGWWGLGEPLTGPLAGGTALIFVALMMGANERRRAVALATD